MGAIPLQVENMDVEFIAEPFRPSVPCPPTMKTSAQWCHFFNHNQRTCPLPTIKKKFKTRSTVPRQKLQEIKWEILPQKGGSYKVFPNETTNKQNNWEIPPRHQHRLCHRPLLETHRHDLGRKLASKQFTSIQSGTSMSLPTQLHLASHTQPSSQLGALDQLVDAKILRSAIHFPVDLLVQRQTTL